MTKLYIFIILLFLSSQLLAQNRMRGSQGAAAPLAPPLPFREVSGIVKDEGGNTITGANIYLTSKKDTFRTTTNGDGIFVIKNVKLAVFTLSITEIGYQPSTRRYLNNDAARHVVLDPIILLQQSNMLKEVQIHGTPSITYKTDTVEYKASDYHVRENATVDELLKKMEGMEVGSDGSLTHQGQQVTKARLNGKDYAGGNVAQAIQNLPADIVDKIQVVDDYGDQAGRTGIKDGDPTKVLNITTRADRSVGNIVRATASDGTDDRYDERLFAQRINANEQLGIIGNVTNAVNGVASTGLNTGATGGGGGSGSGGSSSSSSNSTNGGSGGTTTSGGPSFNYRDQWSKSVQVNASYRYTFSDVYSINNSVAQQFSTLGNTNSTNNSTGHNNSKTHAASFELEFTPDSANFLRITPSSGYSGSNSTSNQQVNETGLQNQYLNGNSGSNNSTPTYGAIVLYQHIFKKPRRNISLQLNYTYTDQQTENTQYNQLQYRDSNQALIKDSLVDRDVFRGSITKNYRASLQYVEPLGKLSQLEFVGQVNYNGYSNDAVTNNVNPLTATRTVVDSLSNIYNYAFTTGRITTNYRLNKTKYNLSLGVTAIPSHLDGANISKGTTTDRNDFFLIPVFRFQYVWSRQERISINYSGSPTAPTFNQLQPVPDYSNPQDPVFGNPLLKPSFTHTIRTSYNNYIADSKFNLSGIVTATITNDQVVANTVQVVQPETKSLLNETYYTNLNGNYNIQGNYNVSKQLDDRVVNLALNGTASYGHAVAMSNGTENFVSTWNLSERFGPRIDPDSWFEVNPFVSYAINKSTNTLPGAFNSDVRTTALAIDGRFFFLNTWRIGYSGSKNYITGISSNITKNPLIINTYLEKEFFKKKNGILRISAFDLLAQNNFINRVITPTSITDTKTNALSRYFMASFVLNLQKWSGTPKRNGKAMQRRGDGSFIY